MEEIKHLVMYSGGIGSWCAAMRVAEKYGTDGLVLLFADTLIEDPDLYRFLDEGAAAVGGRLVKIADGRTPWQVFRDVKYLGNSRVDPCSLHLKRNLLDKWREQNCDRETVTLHFGIDWSEKHRFERLRKRLSDWNTSAPMCEPPYMSKQDMLNMLANHDIKQPRLYELGFPHNNCGGACVKAGHAHFRHLLKMLPNVYAEWETRELEMQDYLQRTDATILNDRRGGERRPMTLKEFRERIERESKQQLPIADEEWGGCGCAVE